MYLQKRVALISLIISIVFIIPFTYFSFNTLKWGFELESWISQLSLSISASSIIVCVTAYLSYRFEKHKFLIKIIYDLRTLFDDLDDYRKVLSIEKYLYINEYFTLRNQVLNHFIELSLEPLCMQKKDIALLDDVIQIYGKLRNMVYYSYIQIKEFESGRKVNRQGLDKILQELNTFVKELVDTNWCNNKAASIMKHYKINSNHSIDENETIYQQMYYKKEKK